MPAENVVRGRRQLLPYEQPLVDPFELQGREHVAER